MLSDFQRTLMGHIYPQLLTFSLFEKNKGMAKSRYEFGNRQTLNSIPNKVSECLAKSRSYRNFTTPQ